MNNKFVYLITAALLITPVSFQFGSSQIYDGGLLIDKHEQSISFTFCSPPYKLKNLSNGETVIDMEGFNKILKPGLLKLPVKTFLIGLPPDSQVKSISIVKENHAQLNGTYNIEKSLPISNGSKTLLKIIDDDTFSSNESFPYKPYEYCGAGRIGKYSYAKIRFFPFSFCQNDDSLNFYNQITIKIDYQKEEKQFQMQLHKKTEQLASRMLINYDKISSFYPKSKHFSNQQFSYVIITTSPLQESVQFLKNWREITTGNPVKIVNVSWIDTNYGGDDLAQKIRNFLKEKYDQWQIEYVLFVGSDTYIPMRECYPNKEDHSSNTITPTDYYYADLNGNWDSDGDKFYGERSDDSPDFSPELYVGRIPVDNPIQIQNICQKIINFEQNENVWKKKALLLGAILNFAGENHNENYDRTDGAKLMEILKENILTHNDYSVTTLYEKEGLNPSTYDCDAALTDDNVKQYWSGGYGIVDWNAHGSPWSSERKIWDFDDGNGIPEENELSDPQFISSEDALYLNDDKPSIVFSCACKNSCPDERDNLGVSVLKKGAVGFIGATSTSWSTIGWNGIDDGGIQTINYKFLNHFVNQDLSCAESLYTTLFEYINNYDWWGWKSYQNMYCFCLYGDPYLSMNTYGSFSPPNIPNIPQGCSEANVSVEAFFSTYSEDPDGQKIYYKWDFGDGTCSSWIGPFFSGETMEVSHSWNEPGEYEIRVEAKDIIGGQSDWSESLIINVVSPELHIENIKGGIGKVKVVLHNAGDVKATDVEWFIEVNNTFFVSHTQGSVKSLDPEESTTIKSDFIFGFGKATVTVELVNLEIKKEIQGLIIGPFIFL